MGWLFGEDRPETREERLAREALDEANTISANIERAESSRRLAEADKLAFKTLSANPPTEAELVRFVACKIDEASRFVDADDPEFPTESLLRGLPLSSPASAMEFLQVVKR